MKKTVKAFFVFFVIALVLEVFVFNFEFFASLGSKEESVTPVASSALISNGDGKSYTLSRNSNETASGMVYFEIENINKDTDYIYYNLALSEESGFVVENNVKLYARDEGNSDYYLLGKVNNHSDVEKTNYIRLHTYGKLDSLKLVIDNESGEYKNVQLSDMRINARVPMFFSILRVLIISLILLLIWAFRPSSRLYSYSVKDGENNMKLKTLKTVLIAVNLAVIFALLFQNIALLNPNNLGHKQYQMLAEALLQGRVDLTFDGAEQLKALANPYELAQRSRAINENGLKIPAVLDIALFNGKFYVYFGIVPVLLFYLPYYLIAGTHAMTAVLVMIMCMFTVLSAYLLISEIIKNYFKNTSFGVQLFLSFMLSNSVGAIAFMGSPTFYYLPIIMSVCFVFTGLSLWLRAKRRIAKGETGYRINLCIAGGSIFMALVAGCRPQFILASFLIIPIFFDVIIKDKRLVLKGNVSKILCVAIPYLIIAAGLMYYNYIRFGSPFDFGANYNLTTNDMRYRSFNLGRIPDGILMYLFAAPNFSAKFPFVNPVEFNSAYVGKTVTEEMFGGVIFTHCFVLFTLLAGKVKTQLKEKRLLSAVIMLVAFSLVVVIADTEMAGILSRYYFDFVYLLLLAAIIVFLALLEKYGADKKLLFAMCVLGFATIAFNFFIGFGASPIAKYYPYGYYMIKSMFT